MIIKKIEIFYIKLPMKLVFKTSFGAIAYRPALIIKITDSNNNVGYGESSLLDSAISEEETTIIGLKVLEKNIIPKIMGKNIKSVDQLHSILKEYINKYPITFTGMESAYLALLAINKKRSLFEMFNGKKNKIPIGKSIGIQKNTKALVNMVGEAKREGYKRVKIKIKPGYDLSVIKYIRKKFPKINLAVDANAAYSEKDLQLFKTLDKYNLSMIEQPFKKKNFKLHATLQKLIKTPICLDESIEDIESTKLAIKMGCGRVINIKPARVGGYINAIKIHNICQANNIPNWVGGRLETGLAKIFNLSLASLPNFSLASEITPGELYLKEDILLNKIKINKGMITVPKMKMASIVINNAILDKYIISYKEFSV